MTENKGDSSDFTNPQNDKTVVILSKAKDLNKKKKDIFNIRSE